MKRLWTKRCNWGIQRRSRYNLMIDNRKNERKRSMKLEIKFRFFCKNSQMIFDYE